MARILPAPDGIGEALALIRSGGVLIYPTETVYGLGGDPSDPAVLDRVRALKGRDASKPMLVLTDEWARVESWIGTRSTVHNRLMGHEPPLPLTLLFRPGAVAPDGLVGPDGWIGIRRTTDATCRALIEGGERPLLSTSANPGGEPPARSLDELDTGLMDGVDLVLDAGATLNGVPSTVVSAQDGGLHIIREGAVDRATVEAIGYGEN